MFSYVGIEGRPVGQRENLAGAGILDDQSAREGVCFLDGLLEFALGDVLNIFVYGENDVLAGLRLFLYPAEPFLARVYGDEHLARFAV